jgi:hypothetical protein
MVRRICGTAALLLTLGLFVAGPAQGQKAPMPPAPGNDIESDKLLPGSFTGTLKGTVTPGADFELEIPLQHLELKPGANLGTGRQVQQIQRDVQQISQAQTRLAQAKNPQQMTQAINQLQRAALNLQNALARENQQILNAFRVVTDKKLVEFHASEDLVVRTLVLPNNGYDEKGNPKKYTPEELKALKGDKPNLPGYTAKADDLKPGAIVVLTMKRAPAPPKDKDAPAKDAPEVKADPKDPKAAPTGPKNIVTMIVIEKDAPDTVSPGDKNKKKN